MVFGRRKSNKPVEQIVEDEFKGTNASIYPSEEERRALKKYQTEGLIILIDQSNLEFTLQNMKNPDSITSFISYGLLVDIIARRGNADAPRRRVLRTYLVTSRQTQTQRRYIPSQRYLKENRIIMKESPDKDTFTPNSGKPPYCDCVVCLRRDCKYEIKCKVAQNNNKNSKRKEKGVDCMLARLMTEEFTGANILRLTTKKAVDRTFCLVAGDYDYVDPVQRALEAGFNVEIWFFTNSTPMAKKWKTDNLCTSPNCGELSEWDLADYIGQLNRNPQEHEDKWSRF